MHVCVPSSYYRIRNSDEKFKYFMCRANVFAVELQNNTLNMLYPAFATCVLHNLNNSYKERSLLVTDRFCSQNC